MVNTRCQHGISCLLWRLWARPSFREKQKHLDSTERGKAGTVVRFEFHRHDGQHLAVCLRC